MKKNKLLHFIIAFVTIMLVTSNFSYAAPLIPNQNRIGPYWNNSDVNKTTSHILGTIRWVGLVIAIGMLTFVGIKYVMASADEKASLKGLLVKVTIGVFIILGAEFIVSLVFHF